jgi:formamidopyrimidine-DNA glycosylase
MPELPEVARTATSLHDRMQNSEISEINILSGRYSRHGNPPGFDEFINNLPMKVDKVSFSGKLLIFYLKDKNNKPWFIWNTLVLSGGWRIEHTKHGHVEVVTDRGNFYFTDPRNFGTMRFTDSVELTTRKANGIGPNHLQHEISDELFKTRLMKFPHLTLPAVMMNQNLIGGIGNYIKAEALYRARLSPHRTVESLTDEDFSLLNESVREVIVGSYENRGATIRTYSGLDGESGDFPFFFKVYGRRTCEAGHEVITEGTQDGRTTWWVPQIQI